MYGYAANGSRRLLNCTNCRGKGDVDCAECRRGVAVCPKCGGDRRLQNWLELEWWRRAAAAIHPEPLAQRFGWTINTPNHELGRDAIVAADVDKPHDLAARDIGNVPDSWLRWLAPPLQPGERVQRQKLRLVRIPATTVRYRLGKAEELATFTGSRLVPPAAGSTIFARRASRLRSSAMLLAVVWCVIALLTFARGRFYFSAMSMLSVAAFAAALALVHAGIADWTALRRRAHQYVFGAAAAAAIGVAFALAALPRAGNAERLIAAGELDPAQLELEALGSAAPEDTWSHLRLARIRDANDIHTIRTNLAEIPNAMPQHDAALRAADDAFLRIASQNVRARQWQDGAIAYALLSERGRQRSDAVSVAQSIYVPLARQKIDARDWRGAGDAIAAARRAGSAAAEVTPLVDALHTAAIDAAASARDVSEARQRLRARMEAERIFVAWETAAGVWGTRALIELRTAMARDVAAAEAKS
jgi:hypothetical protein